MKFSLIVADLVSVFPLCKSECFWWILFLCCSHGFRFYREFSVCPSLLETRSIFFSFAEKNTIFTLHFACSQCSTMPATDGWIGRRCRKMPKHEIFFSNKQLDLMDGRWIRGGLMGSENGVVDEDNSPARSKRSADSSRLFPSSSSPSSATRNNNSQKSGGARFFFFFILSIPRLLTNSTHEGVWIRDKRTLRECALGERTKSAL